MLSLQKPSPETIKAFLAAQSKLDLTYADVGTTATVPPRQGYAVDHTRINLGKGEKAFTAAKAAIERWEHFRLGWVEACCPDTSIRAGSVVAVVARSMGFWWLNACRIVYVVDEDGPVRRFGLAYGTLPDHAGTGEERFLVEWDRADDSVRYDILAFSRPHGLLAHLGYPWFRVVQNRFRRDSAAAMKRAVGEAAGAPCA
ncbi:MAG: DUF1990 domain-containing protein [Planctomycetota bacterium]|nr:DUF1990 domain-containing protein [Planctomycetota bacterium]